MVKAVDHFRKDNSMSKVSMAKVAQNLREYRIKAKLTQYEVSVQAGISQGLVSYLENYDNVGVKKINTLERLAKVLGVTFDDLVK